jgi:hypothetical protein
MIVDGPFRSIHRQAQRLPPEIRMLIRRNQSFSISFRQIAIARTKYAAQCHTVLGRLEKQRHANETVIEKTLIRNLCCFTRLSLDQDVAHWS